MYTGMLIKGLLDMAERARKAPFSWQQQEIELARGEPELGFEH